MTVGKRGLGSPIAQMEILKTTQWHLAEIFILEFRISENIFKITELVKYF